MRRATPAFFVRRGAAAVSIHARHATGDKKNFKFFNFAIVSIHARHATGDPRRTSCCRWTRRFNSRPSCDGRPNLSQFRVALLVFQFTPVMRRATEVRARTQGRLQFQFTPVMRRATALDGHVNDASMFQFTPVMRRATIADRMSFSIDPVSIHARHATGDHGAANRTGGASCFNSRPSCDGRPAILR